MLKYNSPPRRANSTGSVYSTPPIEKNKNERRSLRKLPSYVSPSTISPTKFQSFFEGDSSPVSNNSSPPSEPYSVPITPGSRDNSPPGSVDSSPPRGIMKHSEFHLQRETDVFHSSNINTLSTSSTLATSAAVAATYIPKNNIYNQRHIPSEKSQNETIPLTQKYPPPPPPPSNNNINNSNINNNNNNNNNNNVSATTTIGTNISYQPQNYSPPSMRPIPTPNDQLPPGMSPVPPPASYKLPSTKLHNNNNNNNNNNNQLNSQPPSQSIPPLSLPPPPLSNTQNDQLYLQKDQRTLSPPRNQTSPSRYRQGRSDIPATSNLSPNKSIRRGMETRSDSPQKSQNQRSPQKPRNGRIDTNQMPRPKPIRITYPLPIYHTKSSSGGRKVPPSYLNEFVYADSGNCSPRHMRFTTTAPPSTYQLKTEISIPLALTITPFATPENNEMEVPLVDMKEYGQDTSNPIRCIKCKGYINPFVQWMNEGNNWKCNLCSAVNITPSWYYSPVDGDMRRLDKLNHPELWAGSIDFQVSKDYCVRDPQEAVYVFCLDCSPRAIVSGAMYAALLSIIDIVNQLYDWAYGAKYDEFGEITTIVEGEQETSTTINQSIKIGLVTFTDTIQFYWVRPTAPDPINMHIIDPDDPFPPLPPSCWLLDLSTQKASLDLLFNKLPDLMEVDLYSSIFPLSPNNSTSSLSTGKYAASSGLGVVPLDPSRQIYSIACPAAAIKVTQLALENIGGRIMLLTDSNPDRGFGKIKRQPNPEVYGNSDEFLYYGSLEAVVSSQQNHSLGLGDFTSKKSKKFSENEINVLQQYTQLGKDLLKQNTTVDIFYFVPSLNTIIENDLQRWGYNDPNNLSLPSQPIPPPPPISLTSNLSNQSSRSKVNHLIINTSIEPMSGKGSPAFIGAGIPPVSPKRSDIIKCSNDNSAIYAELTRITGGNLNLFFGSLHLEDNVNRLKSQILNTVKSVSGAEVVMKLRCSHGLHPDAYYGEGQSKSALNDEIELSGIDRHLTSSFSISHSGSYKDGEPIYFQLAILYTSLPSSQRIVRVHNLQLYSSTDPSTIFKHADIDCMVTHLTKVATVSALSVPLDPIRPSTKEYKPFVTTRNPLKNISQYLLDTCLDILVKYRQLCSINSPKGQLILPEALKTLPLYTLCLIKHPALLNNNLTSNNQNNTNNSSSSSTTTNTNTSNNNNNGSIQNKIDKLGVDVCERSAELHRLLVSSPKEILLCLYPRLYPLHKLQEGDGYPIEDRDENLEEPWRVQMPVWSKCSAESIDSEGIYLLDDGEVLWLYFGRCVEQDKITELLGVTPGTAPLSNNASFKGKRILSRQSTAISSLSGEYNDTETEQNSSESKPVLKRILSGEIPPAVQPRSEWSRRVQCIIECARQRNPYKPELKIVWGGEINSSNLDVLRFGVRLVEDSIYGCMSYVDYLCEMHSKITTLLI